ncbi:phage late control D family protein [Aquitalea sp.]|uniref:phage late control D family protein n=1 Tax=Aquitalea sp. TaxID=1872623 RepID=UPI0025865FD9|nr:phage late control D family protein [Aquitalea sp.]
MMDSITDSLMTSASAVLDQAGQLLGSLQAFTQPKQPAFTITLDGKNISSKLADRLISLTLTDNRGFEADQLDIVLDDADGMLDIPPRGVTIKLALGWAGQPLVDKGSYIVDEVEHTGSPDTLTLRARATDLRAGLAAKREKSWHATTLGVIVRAIAKANNLTAAIPDWIARQKVEHIDQTNESDANLLNRLARRFDLVATVKHGKLIVCKAGDAESVSGKPFPTCLITRASGDQHRFNVADRNAYTAVKAQWQDIQRAKRGEVIVDANTRFERRATVTKLGKKSKRTKLAAIQAKGIEPSASNVKVLRHVYASEATALQGAKAAWQKLQRGAAEFSIKLAEGRPELFTELPAKVQGFKPVIDSQAWVINKLTHTLGDGGLVTDIELEMKLDELES